MKISLIAEKDTLTYNITDMTPKEFELLKDCALKAWWNSSGNELNQLITMLDKVAPCE